jgi:transcriptional regulator with XRE-family HTH domain
MEKWVTSREYAFLLRQLCEARKRAGLSQAELAKRLRQSQSFISKCERGERRIDVIELRHFCRALGISFTAFIQRFDRTVQQAKSSAKSNIRRIQR